MTSESAAHVTATTKLVTTEAKAKARPYAFWPRLQPFELRVGLLLRQSATFDCRSEMLTDTLVHHIVLGLLDSVRDRRTVKTKYLGYPVGQRSRHSAFFVGTLRQHCAARHSDRQRHNEKRTNQNLLHTHTSVRYSPLPPREFTISTTFEESVKVLQTALQHSSIPRYDAGNTDQ